MRYLRRFLLVLLGLFLLMLLVAGGIYALLQSSSGQQWITGKLPGWSGGMVQIDAPEGSWPQDVRIGKITVKDADGVWLEVEGLVLRWRPFALFSRTIDIQEIAARKISVLRAPVSDSKAKAQSSSGGFDPRDLPRLRLQKLDIAEIAIAPALTGYAQRLRLVGQAGNDAAGMLAANLTLDTLEGLLTRVQLNASQQADGFSGDFLAQEDAGGILGNLLLLDASQPLHMQGDAALTGQTLQAKLQASEGARAVLTSQIAGQGIGSAATEFTIALAGHLPGQLAADPALAELLGVEGYQLQAMLQLAGDAMKWEINTLKAGPLTAEGKGSVPLNDQAALDADITLHAALAGLSGVAGQALEGELHVKAVAGGTLRKPSATLDASLADVVVQGQTYPQVQLNAVLTPQEDGSLQLTPLALVAGDVRVDGQASFQPEDSTWRAALVVVEVTFAQIAPLLPPGSLPKEWQGNAVLQLQASGTGADMQAQIDGGLSQLRGLPDALGALLGSQVTIQAHAAKTGAELAWNETHITSAGGLVLDSNGTLTDGVLKADAGLRVKDMRVLGDGIPGGSPGVKLHASGPMNALKAEAQIDWAPPDLPKLSGTVTALLSPEWVTLEEANITAAGARVQAKGRWPLAQGTPVLDATIDASDLAALGRYAGQEIAGRLQATAKMEGEALTAKALVSNFVHPSAKLGSAQLDASIGNLARKEKIQARLQLKDASGDGWALTTAQANIASTAAAASDGLPPVAWDIRAKGEAQAKPLVLEAKGAWAAEKDQQTLTIAQLSGQAMGEKFGLDKAATLEMAGQKVALQPATVRFGALVMQAHWAQAPASLNGGITLAPVALNALPGATGLPEGTVQADIALKGTPAQPLLAALLKGEMQTADAAMKPLQWQADVNWQGGATVTPITVTLKADAGSDATVDTRIETQGQLQLEPVVIDLSPDAPLRGQANLKILLEMLNPWLRGAGHRLAGSAGGQIQIGGTLSNPQPQGQIALDGIRYDHLGSGLCVQGLSGQIQATPQAIQFNGLQAKDTHGGSMQIKGGMQLTAPQRTDIAVAMKEFQLFCGGMMTGAIAGDIHAQGEVAGELAVRGKIELGPLSVNLPEAGGASGIPQVKVLNDERAKAEAAAKREGKKESNILLDIEVDATPGRIFVRGQGLDAEFAGALKVKGTAAKPDVIGEFRTKRGKFNLLDRQLQLTEGILRFQGPIPPSPSMSITAESKAADAVAKLVLEGSAVAPKLTLSSTPALPQDEVLARLLFGRELQSISPYQAMQLARAAQQLAGKGGGGPDLLGSVRGALGLDSLSVDQDAAGETTLGTGKYLADGVYVGVEQGRTPESRRIKTELEVIPNITVQTMTGSRGETGGGVEWKYDY